MIVSVIIPAWNAATTLADTLGSLIAQSHPDWEAIVVDDGSTDDTGTTASTWAARDGRIRVVHQPNRGEAAARNRGLAEARGEWLLFLDADDWIAPQHLATMTRRLAEVPEAGAVHCGYARVTASGEVLPEAYRPPEGDLFAVLARRAAFAVHACLVRKSLVTEVGGFDPRFKTSPDWDLWQRVARTGAFFAGVPDVMAFYRMTPASASRDARQLFADGLAVIAQGHRPDPRVPAPAAEHADGVADAPETQAYYLLAWCAGLMIGAGQDPQPLFDAHAIEPFPDLYAPAVAECLHDAVPQATCEGPKAWERMYDTAAAPIGAFLGHLERTAAAPDLAVRATGALTRLVLEHSALSPLVARVLDEQRDEAAARAARVEDEWRRWAESRAAEVATDRDERVRALEARLADEQAARAATDAAATDAAARAAQARADLEARLDLRTRERDALSRSGEYEFGNAVLNRWRLRGVVNAAVAARARVVQSATMARLWVDGRRPIGGRLKVLATACDVFPIYSQTFVYQELTSLAAEIADVRFVYSKLDSCDRLGTSFGWLWHAKRRMPLHRPRHERDFAHYRARYPAKVDAIFAALSAASGLSAEAVRTHDNVLQAFTFTRMVERYRPHYLHSYFFYDRTLMTYVAATLLDLPRGVSCYADHRLQDYELKVVPLHLQTCDVVVATSRRIRDELLALAPAMNPDRILVKPNGIDTSRFPARERQWPGPGDVLRLVTVCRIEPKKGLLDLVDAVALLRGRGLPVEAHIVGDVDEWSDASRDYKGALDARITVHELWGSVHFEGRQTQEGVRRFLELGHVFVAPFVETERGDSDGIPTALLEGMATGLPVVATDAGSIPEVLDNGREGLLVRRGDADALAAAVEELLARPALAVGMGLQAAVSARARFDAAQGEQVFHASVQDVVAARRQR